MSTALRSDPPPTVLDRGRVAIARRAVAIAVAACAVSAPASAALAQPAPLRLDRVDAEPSWFPGFTRLRLYVSAIQLGGKRIDVTGPDAWSLQLGSRVQRKLPYLAGTFAGTDHELAIAVVVETTPEYADALPKIADALRAFVDALPRSAQLAIISYDAEVHGDHRVAARDRARAAIDELEAADTPGLQMLTDAVSRADAALRRAAPSADDVPLRKMIVVVSDGKNADDSPEAYRKVARTAGRHGHPIHALAFAPDDNRRALLGLGELSKRSDGTFRWVRTTAGFSSSFKQLGEEIDRQYVLTFFVPTDEVAGQRVAVKYRDLVSEPPIRAAPACGGAECAPGQYCASRQCVTPVRGTERGALGWVVLIGGVVVALAAAFVTVSLVLGWALRQRNARAALAQAAGEVAAAQAGGPGGPGGPGGVHPNPPHPGGMPPVMPAVAPGSVGPGAPGSGGPGAGHPAMPHTGGMAPVMPGGAAVPPAMPGPAAGHPPGRPSGVHPAGHDPRAAQAPAGASLLILEGPLRGHRIPLHHGFLIGSAVGCHLHLAGDGFASGHHAQILMDTRGGFTLIDRGSTNGTYINGVRTSEKRLSHGMLIRVGTTEARFLAQ